MRHSSGDGAGARVAVPTGWVEVDPAETDAQIGGRVVQLATLEEWDGPGVRPTLSVTITAPSTEHIAARVLADAHARVGGVHVVSIDPWAVPGAIASGRRLVFAHVAGEVTVTTLVWVATTAAGEVVVTARADSAWLHVHDRAFAEAVAGIRLPDEAPAAEPPETPDLLGQVAAPPWTPTSGGFGTAIVADPEARILVEASVARASLKFDATLARDQATVSATASPRILTTGTREPPAGLEHDTSRFRLPVTRLALAVAQWLGLGPAWTAASAPVTVPISLVMNRLVDPTVPMPPGVDPVTWQQPWFLWTLRSSATDSGLVMVDAGSSGQVAVMETDDEHTTRFAPLSSYNVWLTLNWLVSESVVDG